MSGGPLYSGAMKSLPFVPADTFPAVIVPLSAVDPEELGEQSARCAAAEGVDVIEWRVDALAEFGAVDHVLEPHELEGIRDRVRAGWEALRANTAQPVLVTVRTRGEGGAAALTDEAYAGLVGTFIELGPEAVDIEFERTTAEALIARAHDAGVSALASFHDFERTPPAEHLLRLMSTMHRAGADVAKIAVMPEHRTDVLEVLSVGDRAQATLPIPVVAISMGELGKATRLVGREFGSAATFAAVGRLSAPGQLTVPQVRAALDALGAD